MAWQNGQKAGFCILWYGHKHVGDDFTPETYELLVNFDIPDYASGKAAYLQMKTLGVNFGYNHIYINDQLVGSLEPHGRYMQFDSIIVEAQYLRKGRNTLKMIARNYKGGTSGIIDDYWVFDPMLIYPLG